jgi:hypothetical protein
MFHGKTDFADVIEVTNQLTSNWYPGGPNVVTEALKSSSRWLAAEGS